MNEILWRLMIYQNQLQDYVKALFIRFIHFVLNEPFVEAGSSFQLEGGR
jgi:hypothetical protein